MIDVAQVTGMQHLMVAYWHDGSLDNPYDGFVGLACAQHQHNYRLWHEEDIARSPDVGDVRIAAAKRAIDQMNQLRNDAIEKLDDVIADLLREARVESEGPLNTETPGSAIDRLSILSLRLYHLDEQLGRSDVAESHCRGVREKIAVCTRQHGELSQSLGELIADLFAGRKRHRTYRQHKMYNDPALNPYLYVSGGD